jgi:hypothetical protein
MYQSTVLCFPEEWYWQSKGDCTEAFVINCLFHGENRCRSIAGKATDTVNVVRPREDGTGTRIET